MHRPGVEVDGHWQVFVLDVVTGLVGTLAVESWGGVEPQVRAFLSQQRHVPADSVQLEVVHYGRRDLTPVTQEAARRAATCHMQVNSLGGGMRIKARDDPRGATGMTDQTAPAYAMVQIQIRTPAEFIREGRREPGHGVGVARGLCRFRRRRWRPRARRAGG